MPNLSKVLLLLAVLTGCSGEGKPATSANSSPTQTPNPAPDSTASVGMGPVIHLEGTPLKAERGTINGLGLGSPIAAVRAQMGSADGTEGPIQQANGTTNLVWIFSRFRITFTDRRIASIVCSSTQCVTRDSVRIGSSPGEVQRIYGVVSTARLPDGSTISYPLSGSKACSFEFEFTQDRVSSISLSCHPN